MQEYIKLNGIDIPIVRDGNMVYYPISFMGDKVLLKDLSPSQLKQNGYEKYIRQFNIDYGDKIGGIQKTYCISEEGLSELLNRSKIGRLSVEQKVAMNGLLSYLGMDKVDTGERFIDNLSKDKINQYNIFIQDCINEVLKEKPDIKWQKCTKCNNYYPYDTNFFNENQHSSAELNTVCRDCEKWSKSRARISVNHPNRDLNSAYKNYGEDIFLMYKNHDTIGIYKHCIEKKINFPRLIKNKEDYLLIIKYAYDNKWFEDSQEIEVNTIVKVCKLYINHADLTIRDVYLYLFNIDLDDNIINTLEKAKEIFNNYLITNNINIDNVYNFDYSEIFKCASLRGFIKRMYKNDYLKFIVDLYNKKYAPYKFKGGYKNYWESVDNVNFTLKFYIEHDQKIPLEKIPLYLTLNNLQKNARTLYNVIYKKKFHKTLFEWVNNVYPNIFEERDFSVGSIRNYFDSNEEEVVYNYLKDRFKNVIYNKKNCENTVNFKGMIPDYIIFTDNDCWLVEYFGLYVPEKMGNSKRIADYVIRTDKKINTYKTIRYNKIFLYPEDLLDGMKGLEEKVKQIV
ncbi:MAG: hypothetical protein PHT02_00015 [Tissierellia bacterium]|nr:hypothetical protein [Tissierellia bacterium]